jgi:hypothetical protein
MAQGQKIKGRIKANRPGENPRSGCLCSPFLNNKGYGERIGTDKLFHIWKSCPFHDNPPKPLRVIPDKIKHPYHNVPRSPRSTKAQMGIPYLNIRVKMTHNRYNYVCDIGHRFETNLAIEKAICSRCRSRIIKEMK